jgi:hypothetical protein
MSTFKITTIEFFRIKTPTYQSPNCHPSHQFTKSPTNKTMKMSRSPK